MNRLKRIKSHYEVDIKEYRCIFEEEVEDVTQLTPINISLEVHDYLDFAEELNRKDNKIIRKLYGKYYYGDIKIGTGKPIGRVKIYRDELTKYLRDVQERDNNICFNIIDTKDEKIELGIYESFEEFDTMTEKEAYEVPFSIIPSFIRRGFYRIKRAIMALVIKIIKWVCVQRVRYILKRLEYYENKILLDTIQSNKAINVENSATNNDLKMNSEYWYIGSDINPHICLYKDTEEDRKRIYIENVFNSYEECYEKCMQLNKLLC